MLTQQPLVSDACDAPSLCGNWGDFSEFVFRF
ncbi:MAG: hypothetical protein ACI9JP_002817 [Granulosicoccus sp.]